MLYEQASIIPDFALPPPMMPLASEAPSTPIKPKVARECPGAPRRRIPFATRNRNVEFALPGFDDEQPQRGLDSAETLELLPEPDFTVEHVLGEIDARREAIDARREAIDARLEVVLREAAQFKDAARLWRECAQVALLDPTPDWQARAWLDMQAQLVERVGPVEPCVEETLRALFEQSMDLETSES